MKRSIHDYAQALYEAVGGQPDQRTVIVQRFVEMLDREQNRQMLPLIVSELEQLESEKSGRLIVTVLTAKQLTDEQRRRLTERISAVTASQSTELIEQIDPALLGGIHLIVGDQTVDHTLKTKLTTLAARL